jgi:hypothetical protein
MGTVMAWGREAADDWLIEYWAECFECFPETVQMERPASEAQEARNRHVAALVKQQNVAKYRSLIGTKNALVRRGMIAQAMRLAEHIDRHWGAYAD